MTRTQIDLGDIDCNTGTPASGVFWSCGWPEGWDSPEQRGGILEPTGRDGAAGLAPWWSARVLVIKGACRASSAANAWNAYYLLTSGLPGLRGEMELVVHEPTPKGLTAVQHAPPKADPRGINSGNQFQWQLTLRADYPLKRVLTPTTGTLAASTTSSFTNGGTDAAYPVVTTTSSGTVDIVIGGRHFTTTSVASGTVIDMWARTVTAAGGSSLYSAKTPASEWLALPPGATSVSNAGTAALAFAWSDTYA